MLYIIRGRDYSKRFKVEKDFNGKPYLINSNKYISISHTDNYTIVIISKKNVGIDIEKIKKIRPEFKKYLNINSKSKYKFFKEWTRREAMIKRDNMKLSDIKNIKLKGKFRTILFYPYVISICK